MTYSVSWGKDIIRLTFYIFFFSLFGGGNREKDEYDYKFNQLIKNSRIIKVYKDTYISGIIYLIKMVAEALHLILNNNATVKAKEILENIRDKLKNN